MSKAFHPVFIMSDLAVVCILSYVNHQIALAPVFADLESFLPTPEDEFASTCMAHTINGHYQIGHEQHHLSVDQ